MIVLPRGNGVGAARQLTARLCGRLAAWAVLLSMGLAPSRASEADVIYVCESARPEITGSILRIDPATGAAGPLAMGGLVFRPVGVTFGADGAMYVVQFNRTVIRIDPTTATQSLVTSGGYLSAPWGIAAVGGNLYVTDLHGHPSGAGAVIRIEPGTGVQSVVASGGYIHEPVGIAATDGGDFVIVDQDSSGPTGGVIRVNATTGAQTPVWVGLPFRYPYGVAAASGGRIYVTDFVGPTLFRVGSGDLSIVTVDQLLSAPYGIAIEATGDLIVSDEDALGVAAVLRIDPVTGTQAILSYGRLLEVPYGITIGPDIPTPVRQPTLGSLKVRYR